tara:strand:+ start:2886 stop:4373 length:1488 start_codon:yes stop_codon:yes gene_type:complete
MATTYGPAARKMALARMLMANANQPIQNPWNAISNLANTYMGWKMAGQAGDLQDARKADKQAKLQQAIRAGRGWTNPDDTYYQLTEPMRYYHDFGVTSPRGPDALEHSLTRDQWDKKQAEWVAHDRNRSNFPTGSVSKYAKLRPEPLPLSQQPGARLMQSPKGPMVPGSRQAMADVLMGSGHDDLVTMGMKLDPAFRDPLRSRESATIQDYRFFQDLNKRFPLTEEDKRLGNVYSKEAMAFMGMKKGYKQRDVGDRIITYDPLDPTQILRTDKKKLAPSEQPEHKAEVVEAEGGARTRVKLAEALPTRIQGIETKLSNLPFLDRNLKRVKDLAASPTTSGKLGVLTGLDPSSDQYSLNEAVIQFQSLIGLDSLVRLKATGATMGALNKEEMGLLVNKVGSLNTLADPSMLSETLDTIMYLYKKGIRGDQDKFAKEYPNEKPTWQLLDVPNPIHQNAIREANEAIEYQDSQGNDVRDEVRKRLQKKYPNIDLTGLK